MSQVLEKQTFRSTLAVFLILGLSSCSEDETKDDEPVESITLQIQTVYGPVRGMVSDSSRVFRGIPYAAAPVGPLRFAPPQSPEPWEKPLPAEPTLCPQLGLDGVIYGDEDCLTLDLWTPLKSPTSPLPVMVWIHGGGFVMGSGYLADAMLPTRNVVIVAINYRLGVLGFLAHPEFTKEGDGTSGNYGFEDQIFALEWVRDNVSAFGGDPDQVTIFGESAGGSAVGSHLGSWRSAGLFQQAIMQSGNSFGRKKATLSESETQGQHLASAVSCNTDPNVVECLRKLPMETFFEVETLQVETSLRPNFDGTIFKCDFLEALEKGDFNQVPVIIGSNMNEGLGFVQDQANITEEQYAAIVKSLYGEDSSDILSIYPVTKYGTPQLALAALQGHRSFNCSARRGARALSKAGSDVYLYYYSHGLAFHASELELLFGIGALPSDQKVSAAMKDYWTQFARTGDPNGGELPEWPRYDASSDRHLNLADPITVDSLLLHRECDFWDKRW